MGLLEVAMVLVRDAWRRRAAPRRGLMQAPVFAESRILAHIPCSQNCNCPTPRQRRPDAVAAKARFSTGPCARTPATDNRRDRNGAPVVPASARATQRQPYCSEETTIQAAASALRIFASTQGPEHRTCAKIPTNSRAFAAVYALIYISYPDTLMYS